MHWRWEKATSQEKEEKKQRERERERGEREQRNQKGEAKALELGGNDFKVVSRYSRKLYMYRSKPRGKSTFIKRSLDLDHQHLDYLYICIHAESNLCRKARQTLRKCKCKQKRQPVVSVKGCTLTLTSTSSSTVNSSLQ